MRLSAQTTGINNLVIDADARDRNDIEAMDFIVFSTALWIRGTSNFGEGILNEVITIGGVLINPGDTIVGYLDGVLVVPIVLIEEAIENQLQEKYNRKI